MKFFLVKASIIQLNTLFDEFFWFTFRRKRDAKDKYITFLTELTNDVVRKGIYTNKGLKALFKSHTEQNKQLNPVRVPH